MRRNRQYGFTLSEIAIVLLITSLLVAGGLVILTASIRQTQYNTTIARMDAIHQALLNYSNAYRRIPCPSSLAVLPSDPNYGVEAAVAGVCSGGAPAVDFTSSSGVAEGAVPVRTLRLSDDMMYDGWGRKFRYAVDPLATAAAGSNSFFPPQAGGLCSPSTSSITVKDATGAARTTAAIYVLVSHGQNGHGGYTRNALAVNAQSVNSDEQKNCHCTASAVAATNDGIYVQRFITAHSSNLLDGFDDVVDYRELWQMKTATYSSLSPACVYVLDSGNNLIQKYVTNTSSWTTMSYSFNSPKGISIDVSGNVWVADGGFIFNSLKKYSSGTGSWSTFMSGLGILSSVYVDINGNIWLPLVVGGLIDEYNSLGSLLSILSNGLSSPSGLYIDINSNLWLCDAGNNRILKFNGSVWVSFGGSGTSAGQFNNPKGIYVDLSGNVWVVDSGNNRIQKYDGTTWTAYGGVSAGVTAGSFSAPQAISGDAYGNIWVADTGNNRVEEYQNGKWKIFANYGAGGTAFSAPNGIAVNR